MDSELNEEVVTLFHIVSRGDWRDQVMNRMFGPPSLNTEGFIHLSAKNQVLTTANYFFKGSTDLLLLEIQLPSRDPSLKWEAPVRGSGERVLEKFPHYYAKLKVTAVKKVHDFPCDSDGVFALPAGITE
jgi:uncharacterized protein (DUF952 family)